MTEKFCQGWNWSCATTNGFNPLVLWGQPHNQLMIVHGGFHQYGFGTESLEDWALCPRRASLAGFLRIPEVWCRCSLMPLWLIRLSSRINLSPAGALTTRSFTLFSVWKSPWLVCTVKHDVGHQRVGGACWVVKWMTIANVYTVSLTCIWKLHKLIRCVSICVNRTLHGNFRAAVDSQ